MVSVKAIMQAGYHAIRMFPLLLLPLQLKGHARRATDAFEDELLRSGLSPGVARALAKAYEEANNEMMRQFASLRALA